MKLSELAKSVVKAVAPTLGTALGGPLGGAAARAIADKLLGNPNAGEKELEAALLGASPDQLVALKKADQDFAVSMEKLGVDLEQIHADDRGSARAREMALKDRTPTILAIMVLAAFFGYIGAVTFLKHNADIGLVNVAVGWLGGTASSVVAYYFGSSSGSKQKTDLMAGKK